VVVLQRLLVRLVEGKGMESQVEALFVVVD